LPAACGRVYDRADVTAVAMVRLVVTFLPC
jgi:hypothetical protein